MKIGLVVSSWYLEEITSKMLEHAKKVLIEKEIDFEVMMVPGTFEIPFGVQTLLQKNGIDGVVTLGAIIKGKTDHDSLIAYTVSHAITKLSLDFKKPVVLGINGPNMSREQAIERIPRAAEVTKACIEMINKN